VIPQPGRDDAGHDPPRCPRGPAAGPVPLDAALDDGRTAYPFLRRVISSHLRAVGDFIALNQPDAARTTLDMALAVRAELEITPERRR
jgi:hypothetical protein